MPTLIELSPETRGEDDFPPEVTAVVEVAVKVGDPAPEFFFWDGRWETSHIGSLPLISHHDIEAGYRFARRAMESDRATQSEIDATRAEASPSVGRDELVEVCKKVEAWLYRLAAQADKQAEDTRFPSLVEASKADAKNYRAVATELRHAIAAALAAAGKGE